MDSNLRENNSSFDTDSKRPQAAKPLETSESVGVQSEEADELAAKSHCSGRADMQEDAAADS